MKRAFHVACAQGAFLVAAAALLAGCGVLREHSHAFYDAELTGAQEVPAVPGRGTGRAELRLDQTSNELRWRVTYSGLSGPVTGAHIHGPAGPGQNAAVRIPFSGNLNAQPIEGRATLTPQQATELASGLWYVNLHTAANPNGEVRGQLRVAR